MRQRLIMLLITFLCVLLILGLVWVDSYVEVNYKGSWMIEPTAVSCGILGIVFGIAGAASFINFLANIEK